MKHGEPLHELTDEQRAGMRKELAKDLVTLVKRSARAVGQATAEHIQSPEGQHTAAFLQYADDETGGLLGKLGAILTSKTAEPPTVTQKK